MRKWQMFFAEENANKYCYNIRSFNKPTAKITPTNSLLLQIYSMR